ncbi:MAG: hypothetical protein K2J40_08250 [Ruminococcus sp.]|nr:hypothetical protein [Ruminococcus sp.]
MSFVIDSTVNNGYPHIPDMPELPSVQLKKPHYKDYYVVDEDRNNGYPTFGNLDSVPETAMQKIYPHGLMMCMGNDVNDGYPFIPEISGIIVREGYSLYFGSRLISEMYYGKKQIFSAYCNDNEVFGIKYVHI